MAKRKKFKAKELKHDPFRDWYERQAEWVSQRRDPVRQTLYTAGLVIVLLVAISLGYSFWKGTAEQRLAVAFDIYNAGVSDTLPANAIERRYRTEGEKYRAALEAYKRVSDAWYYKYSDYGELARYYEALCQLHLKSAEGQPLLEQVVEGDSTTARLARSALAEHLIAQGDAEGAEKHYRQLIEDPGQLPKTQLQLGLARSLELQGKKDEAIAVYLEVAKEQSQEPEGQEAVTRLAELDPKALDQLPEEQASATPDVLSRYKRK